LNAVTPRLGVSGSGLTEIDRHDWIVYYCTAAALLLDKSRVDESIVGCTALQLGFLRFSAARDGNKKAASFF
jgi:gluconate kinase